jgi:ADP-Ribosyltransferase in polyvalent proteins
MRILEIYDEVLTDGMSNIFYHGSPYVFDRFDINKVGSGDGLSKFGYGLYFSPNKQTAVYYAKELSIGQNRQNGLNLYTVKLLGIDDFYNWEDETPEHIAQCIMRKLNRVGESDKAEQISTEYEEYGNYWSIRSMYEILESTLGSKKETTEFLNICGVNGVIGESPAHNEPVYTVYDDRMIKIIDVTKIQ